MGNLRRIFYVSRVDSALDDFMVKGIVSRAQRANRQWDITGVLAHSGKHFAQVLEGTEDKVAILAERIRKDTRHFQVTVLLDEPISKRDHAEWSMGYLYDAGLSDEIEQALNGSTPQLLEAHGRTLAYRIFLHVNDLARP